MTGYGRLDPVVSTVARWSDEDPAAMRRLLEDGELRAQVARALEDLIEREDGPGRSVQVR